MDNKQETSIIVPYYCEWLKNIVSVYILRKYCTQHFPRLFFIITNDLILAEQ